ncbi:MAG: DUF427 domain-containing protein [Microthrixaceae bacterium]
MFGDDRLVVVRAGERVVARSTSTVRVLETAGAPAFYIPPADVDEELLVEVPGSSICEVEGASLLGAPAGAQGRRLGLSRSFTPFEPLAGLRSTNAGPTRLHRRRPACPCPTRRLLQAG